MDHARRGLWHTYRNWRYAILFYSLLLTLAVGPLRSALGVRVNLLELFLGINLLVAVVPIGGRKTRRVLLPFLAVILVVRISTAWLDVAPLVPINMALWTVVALLAAASALRFALGARVVDREHLYAGLSALGRRTHLARLARCTRRGDRTRCGCPEQCCTHNSDLL
jgi:hypothetical protein